MAVLGLAVESVWSKELKVQSIPVFLLPFNPAPEPTRRSAPCFETSDRTTLFYTDWGTGDPVVFVHGQGLGADM